MQFVRGSTVKKKESLAQSLFYTLILRVSFMSYACLLGFFTKHNLYGLFAFSHLIALVIFCKRQERTSTLNLPFSLPIFYTGSIGNLNT